VDTVGNYLEIAKKSLTELQLSFSEKDIYESENLAKVKEASIVAMRARDGIEDLFIGKLSKLTNLMTQSSSDILDEVRNFSKNETSLQLMKMLESDIDPLIVLDQEGNLGALKLEEGKVVTAVKPNWLNNITVFRNSRTLKYGDESRNDGIDRNAYRRKSRFENQARRDENNYSKAKFYGKRKMDPQ
jgi:hypothetical protein